MGWVPFKGDSICWSKGFDQSVEHGWTMANKISILHDPDLKVCSESSWPLVFFLFAGFCYGIAKYSQFADELWIYSCISCSKYKIFASFFREQTQFPSAFPIADTRTQLEMASHMGEEKEVELLLEEIPEGTNSKPRHLYVAGAGLTLLMVLGVAAKMMYQAPQPLGKFNMNTIQEWRRFQELTRS